MNTRGMLLTGLATICCIALIAQDKTKPAKADAGKAAQQQSMPMPTPAPEMTKLIKAMSGTWTVSEKGYPSPMMPKGGTGKGTAVLTPGPGNMSLVEKYHSTGMMGGAFNGMGVFWWDAKAQLYRGTWCDTMTPTGCDSSGTTKWEGDNLIGTMEGEMNGQKMITRFVYSDFKPNSFVMTMESGADPKALTKAMTITYTKGATTATMEKPKE